ncbi:MAG: CDP-diacylglycerol--glycerol-3-phosphate 3-phosphatidyltransferase [Clostridia bacterium]|jgi:CDP-diacylglycerol--glycerol-3-phosphate 3-phosphatidyltransferase|nr:CDP-diacylglycerol--glycerol-3-phosphate 3-phosphatidyltransferase [Clostridia bacterium]
MNLANKLTIFRIILVPIMVVFAYIPINGDVYGIAIPMLIMEAIFIIASITDKLDGYIARSRNQVTTFGKFLDPLADKILVLSAMVILVEMGKLPAWIPIIVLAREFIVSGFRLIAVEKGGVVIAASVWGKIKTVTQMIALISAFVDIGAFFSFINGGLSGVYLIINIVTSVMMLVSTIATIFSGIDYIWKGRKILSDK